MNLLHVNDRKVLSRCDERIVTGHNVCWTEQSMKLLIMQFYLVCFLIPPSYVHSPQQGFTALTEMQHRRIVMS